MNCNFNRDVYRDVNHKDGEIEEDVKHKIKELDG